MNDCDIIDHHIIIRGTIGYDGIKDIEEFNISSVMQFLKVVYNYINMKKVYENL